MDMKKIIKSVLYPHIALMIVLLPVAAVFLIYSMVFMGTDSIISIVSYVVAFYTLTVWFLKIPFLISFFKTFRAENKYALRWRSDPRLRVNVSLYGTLIYNTAYAVFQLGLGFWHKTFWFFSLAAYYILLAIMRFFLVRHTRKHAPGEDMMRELKKYRTCGIVFLIMNLALALMIFFMVYWNRTFHHHEITTIAMAAYTFTSLTFAIINIFRYRKYNSPVFSASKAISLASACVSLITLESTMLTTFGAATVTLSMRRIMLAATGGAISVFIIAMAITMIVTGTKKLKSLKEHLNGE